MSQYSIAVAIGSLRRESHNRKLANALMRMAPAGFSFKELRLADLPLYNEDDDANPPGSAVRLKEDITAVHGLLIVTPEYNRSIPGMLKNALDHGSRPYGQNAWANKPAGVIGASPGAIGTALAQQHLRNILAYLDVPVLGQPEAFVQVKEGFFDEQGNVTDAKAIEFLEKWMSKFTAFVEAHAGAA